MLTGGLQSAKSNEWVLGIMSSCCFNLRSYFYNLRLYGSPDATIAIRALVLLIQFVAILRTLSGVYYFLVMIMCAGSIILSIIVIKLESLKKTTTNVSIESLTLMVVA